VVLYYNFRVENRGTGSRSEETAKQEAQMSQRGHHIMSCVVENFAVRPNQSHLRLFESIPLRKVCVCSCYYSTVSVPLSCIVSEIKRHVGQKSRFSYSYNNTLCVYGYKHSLASLTPLNVLPREATHKRGLYRRAVSVCLSVTFVTVSKQINISS